MFYDFYGLSGVQLVLLNLSSNMFKTYLKPLNNPIDYQRALELKSELYTLKNNLNELNVGYTTPEGRKLEFNLKKYEQGKIELTNNEIQDIKNKLDELPKTVIGSKIYNKSLTSEECAILNVLYDKMKVIDRYISCIENKIFEDRRVYGIKLSYALGLTLPDYIMNIICTEIKNSNKATLPFIYKRFKDDIEFIHNLSNSDTSSKVKKDNDAPIEDGNPELVNVKNYILRVSNNNKYFKETKNMNLLLSIYNQCKIFDDVDFYNDIFDLNLDKDKYIKIFNNLMECGIIGLNFEASKLFIKVASCLTFAKENETLLAEDHPLNTVAKYLERIISSNSLKSGESYD